MKIIRTLADARDVAENLRLIKVGEQSAARADTVSNLSPDDAGCPPAGISRHAACPTAARRCLRSSREAMSALVSRSMVTG